MDDDIFSAEEVEKEAPPDRLLNQWADLVRPLADRIAKLPDGKCLRLNRLLTGGIISATRHQLETRHAARLLTRQGGGCTYLWNGGPLAGSRMDLERRRERMEKDKPHHNI